MDGLSFIIPAFRASGYIRSTVREIWDVFGRSVEIIIVDEYNDSNAAILKGIVSSNTNIKILQFRKILGKGKAITEGLKIATGNVVGFIDADCPCDLTLLKEELKNLYANKFDCIIFSKWKGQSFWRVKQPFMRKISSRIFNLFVKMWVGLPFRDTQGGAKFMTRNILSKIGIDFYCNGFVFDVELLKRLTTQGARIKEAFIPYYRTEVSTINLCRDIFPVLKELLPLRWRVNGKDTEYDQ